MTSPNCCPSWPWALSACDLLRHDQEPRLPVLDLDAHVRRLRTGTRADDPDLEAAVAEDVRDVDVQAASGLLRDGRARRRTPALVGQSWSDRRRAAPPGDREQQRDTQTAGQRPAHPCPHGAPSVTCATPSTTRTTAGTAWIPRLAGSRGSRDAETARAARLPERLEAVLALGRQHVDGRARAAAIARPPGSWRHGPRRRPPAAPRPASGPAPRTCVDPARPASETQREPPHARVEGPYGDARRTAVMGRPARGTSVRTYRRPSGRLGPPVRPAASCLPAGRGPARAVTVAATRRAGVRLDSHPPRSSASDATPRGG